jgi:hypothetical protein
MAFLQNEDAARAFEAALSFVDEYTFADGDGNTPPTAMGRAQPAVGPQPAVTDDKMQRRARANAKKRLLRKAGLYDDPNRARKERKLEMTFLRRKFEQLQLELKTLQSQRTGSRSGSGAKQQEQGSRALVTTNKEVSSAWKDVASRQREQRDKAEKENVRLRLIMERQHKLAEALETLVQARIKQQMAEFSALSTPRLGRSFTSRTLDFRADINDFRGLLGELEQAHREVDAVFAANRLNTTESSHHGVQLRSSKAGNGMRLEVFSNKAMPFNLRDTAEATWDHFKGMKKHGGNGNLYDKAAKVREEEERWGLELWTETYHSVPACSQSLDSPYTIIEDYAKELFANTARADVRVKQIVRRYVEADRELVILVASVSPVSIAHKPLAGLTFNYRCYALIKRAAAATKNHDLALLQMCTLASLVNDDGGAHDPAYMRALGNFVLGNTAGNIKADQELIENVLVEQVLGQP